MLDDKLLDNIKYIESLIPQGITADVFGTTFSSRFSAALKAVVELHKPIKTTPPWEYEWYIACSACENYTNDGAYFLEYPCPTIKAIMEVMEW